MMKLPSGPRVRVLLLIVIMGVIATVTAGIAIVATYRTAYEQQRERLVEVTKSRARMIEAVARYELAAGTSAEDLLASTLRVVADAQTQFEGFGETGEINLAQRQGDNFVYLTSQRHSGLRRGERLPLSSNLGEPMRRALSGESGTVVGPDYRGETVLAAHEPVSELDLGIVAKIDIRELRAPFFKTGGIVALAALVLIAAGLVSFRRIGEPLVMQLEHDEALLRDQMAELQLHRIHLESLVMERTSELESANKELESFSYSVAHDLRAPLRAIDGFSKILEEDYANDLDAEGRKLLLVVRNNTRRMAMLIDDLLALAKLSRVAVGSKLVDMAGLVEKVLVELKQQNPNVGIDVVVGPMPAAVGDAVLINQAWTNLLSNAVKFANADRALEIRVTGSVEKNRLVYCVKDNGVGFDMQYVGKLFGLFERLHGSAEFAGTGVGLAIVKRIVARHGGEVWAEGKVGEGAAFFFSLPVRGDI